MKRLTLLLFILTTTLSSNAQFNFSYTDASVPVKGGQYGLVYGGHSALLINRDDIDAPNLNPKVFNLTYFFGFERIQWHTPHFGFGQQLLYWCGGAAYKGTNATTGEENLVADTEIPYIKIPALFWWKSYSRWHPDRRIRANAFFGPYVAFLIGGDEAWTTKDQSGNEYIHEVNSGSYQIKNTLGEVLYDGNADDSNPYKMLDYGFTMGGGIEFRLWTRTVIGITLRADLGLADVENKDFQVVNPTTGERYAFYKDITSKYSAPTMLNGVGEDFNRPETRNLSYGVQLSVRKYFGAK